jgi:hypothetical protein
MSEVKVDTISERTAANGVAVDGVTIKDSGLTIPSGGTLTVASGGTITNSGTATGFPSSPFVKISSQTISSAVSALTFTDVFSATYEAYLILISGLEVVNNSQAIRMYIGNSDLSTTRSFGWQSSMHSYNSRYSRGATADAYFQIIQDTANGIIGGPACGQIWVHKPFDSSTATKMTSHMETYDVGTWNSYAEQVSGAQVTNSSSDVSFKFVSQTGNLGSTNLTGRVTVLGVSHA